MSGYFAISNVKTNNQLRKLFGANGTEKNRGIADTIPLFKAGRKIKVGMKPKVSRAKQPKIGTMEPEGTAPDVDWNHQDLQDSVRHVTSASIIRDYVPERERGRVTVYPAYVASEQVPHEVCAEEECDDDDEEDGGGYDWDEFSFHGTFPPAKLSVDRHGKIHIVDGNHRIRYWRSQRSYQSIPAWVIDYRRVKND